MACLCFPQDLTYRQDRQTQLECLDLCLIEYLIMGKPTAFQLL